MKKPSIPAVNVQDKQIESLLRPIKENIEIMNGIRGGSLTTLGSTATLSDVINRLNDIINRLNA